MHTKDNEVAKVYGLVFCIVAFFVFLGAIVFAVLPATKIVKKKNLLSLKYFY